MLDKKIEEFQQAMERYNNNIFYNKLGIFVAIIVVSLQIISLASLLSVFTYSSATQILTLVSVFIFAYIMTDFINGLIHMLIDNNTNYSSIVGPLIAVFHFHHKQPKYKDRRPLQVYFYESGAKNWLPIYLLVVILLQYYADLTFNSNFFLVAFGILSSVAEVSHYWCHNANDKNTIIRKLQKFGILLSKDHHKYHHIQDNINYAFLNGITDPIINKIAGYLYNGYKNHADLHVLAYNGNQTQNRG